MPEDAVPEAFTDEIKTVVEDFTKRGWLSEERYTEQVVHAKKHRFGSMRIAHELKERGIAEHLIHEAVAEVKASELDNAKSIWHKKFGSTPANREEWAKQARFLQSRGFGFEIIKRVLKYNPEED